MLCIVIYSCKKTSFGDENRHRDSIAAFNKLIEIHSASLKDVTIKEKNTTQRLDSLLSEMEKKNYRYPLMVGYIAYSFHGDPKTLQQHLIKAQNISNSTNDSVIKAINYQLKAKFYNLNNDRQNAFRYALFARDYSKGKEKETYDNTSLKILSDIAFANGNNKAALHYSNEILQRDKKRTIDPIFCIKNYVNIALLNAKIGRIEQAQKYYDSAQVMINKHHYRNVYLLNSLKGFLALGNKNYAQSIDYFNQELGTIGQHQIIYLKKAEAFHFLNKRDSVIRNLSILEKNLSSHPNKNNEILREYLPLKIKYTQGKEKELLLDQYTHLVNNILKENNATIIEKYRHDYNILNLEKENAIRMSKEKRMRTFFLLCSIVLALVIVVIIYMNANERKKLEIKMVTQQYESLKLERNRISREMHDDLGAHFTSISLAQELLLIKNKNVDNPELNIILKNTTEIYFKINEIIWSMDMESDHVSNLILYTKKFLKIFLKDTSIEWSVQYHNQNQDILLEPYIKRNLFLVIKEIINNIVKHASASFIKIDFGIKAPHLLTLKIADNGIGFNVNDEQKGKGLKNIKNTISQLNNSTITIDSSSQGSIYRLLIKTQ